MPQKKRGQKTKKNREIDGNAIGQAPRRTTEETTKHAEGPKTAPAAHPCRPPGSQRQRQENKDEGKARGRSQQQTSGRGWQAEDAPLGSTPSSKRDGVEQRQSLPPSQTAYQHREDLEGKMTQTYPSQGATNQNTRDRSTALVRTIPFPAYACIACTPEGPSRTFWVPPLHEKRVREGYYHFASSVVPHQRPAPNDTPASLRDGPPENRADLSNVCANRSRRR